MHRCYPECRPGHHVSKSMETLYRDEVKYLKAKMPDPDNFNVKDVFEYGPYKVLLVNYPGCTNFKGDKCMVVECSMVDLVKAKRIDPHFDDVMPSSKIKIIARFPPNSDGIAMAKNFAKALQKNQLGPASVERGGSWDR